MAQNLDFGWWIAFTGTVVSLLLTDLFVFHRRPHEVRPREAAIWCAFWIGLAVAFNVFVYVRFGAEAGAQFATAYVVEESLSVDNLFVFAVILGYFNVPRTLQHYVLFWGIVGALVTRGAFIGVGSWLIATFTWSIYLFGAVLLYTGGRLAIVGDASVDIEANPVICALRRLLPVANRYHNRRFIVRVAGATMATPLLVVLLMVESTDIVFALDSIPAVFSVSRDPFIVFTSNIFAILGLRALYFLLANVVDRFHLLRYGLAIVLVFTGAKMIGTGFGLHVGTIVSLAVIATVLSASVLLSMALPAKAHVPDARSNHDAVAPEPPGKAINDNTLASEVVS